jgi:hypothetical protein
MRNGLLEVKVTYVIYGPIIILANVNIEANKIYTIQIQLLAYFETNLKQIKKSYWFEVFTDYTIFKWIFPNRETNNILSFDNYIFNLSHYYLLTLYYRSYTLIM